jgi:hypothetical protein
MKWPTVTGGNSRRCFVSSPTEVARGSVARAGLPLEELRAAFPATTLQECLLAFIQSV